MLELKKPHMKTTKIMTATIVLSTIFVLSTLTNNDVFSITTFTKEIKIKNLMDEILVSIK